MTDRRGMGLDDHNEETYRRWLEAFGDGKSDEERDEEAARALKELLRNKRRILSSERRSRRGFETRLRMRYRTAFDRFELLIVTSREVGTRFNNRHAPQAEVDNDPLFWALIRIHARSCQVASEIQALLVSGHASGAMARWRTLHELSVIALFLRKHGKQAARQYLEHRDIRTIKEAETHLRYHKGEVDSKFMKEVESYRAARKELVKQYGEDFLRDYGWAVDFVRDLSFAGIEKAVEMDFSRPAYGLASHSIHSGIYGMLFDIGYGDFEPDRILVGPSNAGLYMPGINTAIDIVLCAYALLSTRPDDDSTMPLDVLMQLAEECRKAFETARNQINADEALHRSIVEPD
jgi:hypothetical protein